jgi:hypothetical protein
MTITAKIITDSVSLEGIRLATFELRYPRIVHSELMTHRVFSRGASSSRAIPISRSIKDILRDPAEPVAWGSNKPGMQAGAELTGIRHTLARMAWHGTKRCAILGARISQWVGAHKQVANRILEPWSHISVVVTSTDYENWFALRCHPNADPTLKALADTMFEAREASTPGLLQSGEWHLPYITERDRLYHDNDIEVLKQMSAARCARVSYNNHDGTTPSLGQDMELFGYLMADAPVHASPTEHQATPDKKWSRDRWSKPKLHGNFYGWIQFRKTIPGEAVRER